MSRNVFMALGTIASSVAGAGKDISALKAGTVGVNFAYLGSNSPAWSGTIVVEISHDAGVTFVLAPEGPEGSANNPSMTAAGSYRLPVAAQQIRARATSYSSGSMVCTLGGEDPNLMP